MTQVLDAHFGDVDEFTETVLARGWRGRVRQTEAGAFSVDLRVVSSAAGTMLRARHSVGGIREITTPAGSRTFGLVLPATTTNRWCGRDFDRGLLQLMPRSDYVASNAGAHLGYQLAFDETLIADTLESLEARADLVDDAWRRELDADTAQRLARHLDALVDTTDPNGHRQLLDDTLSQLLLRFAGHHERPRTRAAGRRRAFERARAIMDARLAEPLNLGDICRLAATSRRTLTLAFHEQLGISPMQYLKVIRLHQVRRRLLLAGDQPLRISDVANDAGFWHLGQFAVDYRRLFGERPSDTRPSAGPRTGTDQLA